MTRSITLILLTLGVLFGGASAQTERVLYSFCAQSGCTDGLSPNSGLALDQQGNVYGTTWEGGANRRCNTYDASRCGTLFKVTPAGKETVLYSFCAQPKCADGAVPSGGIVLDREGNLYGATYDGGHQDHLCRYQNAAGCGVVFKLSPARIYTVLYRFCAQRRCKDGANPSSDLVLDREGNIYGTTAWGGAHGGGTVFKLTPRGNETVLYSFCARGGCADGWMPDARVTLDEQGNLYGTTFWGGNDCFTGYGCGVVFKLTPKGQYQVLHAFCSIPKCGDGAVLRAAVIIDHEGNLYGTTVYGGAHGECGYCGGGTVFKLSPLGKETVLYSFCKSADCTDGTFPGQIVFHGGEKIYGTTQLGGANTSGCFGSGCGTVFEVTSGGRETVLHSFCSDINCTDGARPITWLVFGHDGNMYGTTWQGGVYGGGDVFALTP
jgi:uncharacterized repeat protein (TIGR03803 family)